MSRPPLAARRDKNEAEIVSVLEAAGCDVYRLDLPCDLLVGRGGVNYLLEVKSDKGLLTPGQERFGESWRGSISVVRTAKQALEAVGLIRRAA